jgi:uncharacterized protein YifN (PemK superfamily)
MITSFKIFENESKPKVGDYVICSFNVYDDSDKLLKEFLENNIGIIKNIKFNDFVYWVEYNDVPYKLSLFYSIRNNPNILSLRNNNIVHYSENVGDLEPYIVSKKYNL